jgi:hypothetical protein
MQGIAGLPNLNYQDRIAPGFLGGGAPVFFSGNGRWGSSDGMLLKRWVAQKTLNFHANVEKEPPIYLEDIPESAL